VTVADEGAVESEKSGGGVTVKGVPLVARPPTTTTTFPVVAPVGTGTTMLVELQLIGAAAVPLNVIVLAPCVAPKPVPVIVTDVPVAPDDGFRLLMIAWTEKFTKLLRNPLTATNTFPVVASVGTGTTMVVSLQIVGVPVAPLKLTKLVPCDGPKLEPVIVTDVPTGP